MGHFAKKLTTLTFAIALKIMASVAMLTATCGDLLSRTFPSAIVEPSHLTLHEAKFGQVDVRVLNYAITTPPLTRADLDAVAEAAAMAWQRRGDGHVKLRVFIEPGERGWLGSYSHVTGALNLYLADIERAYPGSKRRRGLIFTAAHEATHAAQDARGEVLIPHHEDPDYANNPHELEANLTALDVTRAFAPELGFKIRRSSFRRLRAVFAAEVAR